MHKLPTCLLCGASNDRLEVAAVAVYGGGEDHQVLHCKDCDVRFLHPGLSAEDEMRFYAKEFEHFMKNRSAADAGWDAPLAHIEANRRETARRMGHLAPLMPAEGGRVLEVGCSSGFMLRALRDRGMDCVGVEPSGVFSDFVRHSGFPCFPSVEALAAQAAPGGYDLILHYYVLEHVREAQGFLESLYAMLRPGGLLVFEVPHAQDALAALYDVEAYHRFIWVISHRWYFSEPSLLRLVRQLDPGAQVKMDQRYDLSNHLVWLRDGRPGGMNRFTGTLGEDLENAYRRALIDAGLGDTLIGILRK